MSKIALIIEHEFMSVVKKKSFIVTTLLTPIFIVFMMFAPAILFTPKPAPHMPPAVVEAPMTQVANDGQEDTQIDLEQIIANEQHQTQASNTVSGIIGIILGMILYFIMIVYGNQVLQSVINEKQSRVLDVLVTSCSPTEIMMGKILGIALVAALQILIWAVLIMIAGVVIFPMIMSDYGIDIHAISQTGGSAELISLASKITNLGFMSGLFLEMLLFMIGGFLFYAAMYAAIGSSVDTPQDAAQFNSIVIIPVVIGMMVMANIVSNPDSDIVFWCSMIPFTSPMVMMARIPFGIPTWQIVVSIAVLYISFIVMTWLAGRIFRIGVFMHGKKPTWKDLADWIKMK